MADEIKSIEEMCRISPAFKTNITTMKQLDEIKELKAMLEAEENATASEA